MNNFDQQNLDQWKDPIIELYKKDVDMTLILENLKLTVDQRVNKLMQLQKLVAELRLAGSRARKLT